MAQQMLLSRFETTLQLAFHLVTQSLEKLVKTTLVEEGQPAAGIISSREQTNKKRLKVSIAEVTLREFKTPVHAVTDLVT